MLDLKQVAVKLRESNFSEEQITLVIGELTEHRQAFYLQGYEKGYNEGYEKGREVRILKFH